MNYTDAANTAWELIFEEYSDLRYELYGPEGYDRDYKAQLKEDGDWEAELARWEPPDEDRAAKLEVACDTLLWAMDACEHANWIHDKRWSKRHNEWPYGRPYKLERKQSRLIL